jgi:hypothetical protein
MAHIEDGDVADLVASFVDTLNSKGHLCRSYRDEAEGELIRRAAAQAVRSLGRPTRAFDKPGRLDIQVTNWGYTVPALDRGGRVHGHRVAPG